MKGLKKWLLAIAVILSISISCIYIFIPGELDVSVSQETKCNASAAFRKISDEGSWAQWWPNPEMKGFSWQLNGKNYPNVAVTLQSGNHHIPGLISVLTPGSSDSTALYWKCRFHSGLNPFDRIARYQEAVAVRKKMVIILSAMGTYLENKENVYGMEILNTMSRDSCLIVVQIQTLSYPSTAEIYRSIQRIREYISKRGASETNYPMLHVTPLKDGRYESMIAVPLDRTLPWTGPFIFRRFVPWKALTGEVHGGPFTAERAMEQLRLYVTDYQKVAMAISFQSLVTERDREADTSRWTTRVLVPVP
jgi:hypothetical protein